MDFHTNECQAKDEPLLKRKLMNVLTLASRNVYRNWQRSLVTTLAMAFACTIMIIFAALIEGMVQGSEHNAVSMNNGDIQLHVQGYRDDPDIYMMIPHAFEIAKELRASDFYATPRLHVFGLIASDESSAGAHLRGIDLEYEKTVTVIHQYLQAGLWLDVNDRHGVVIGKKLARSLDVGLGDELVFIGQTADGFMANDLFKVRGILKTVSPAIDSGGIFISNAALQELITLPDGAHEIALMRKNRRMDLDAEQHKATAIVQKVAGESFAQIEIMSWRQLMPIISRFLETAQVQTLIMLAFTYIAVASVILNAMLMSVFERIHEFGIMKAIGVTPWQLIRLVYAETFLQTLLASVLGVLVGGALAWYFQQYGIDMSAISSGFSFAGIALDPIWYAYLTLYSLASPVIFLFVIAFIAVIYPAVKVALIRPLDAIHYQ